MKVQLLAYTPDADKIVAAAAKLCYSKTDASTLLDNLTEEKTNDFLELLHSLGHESPVEHASFTFAIEGVSRTLLAQLTRHRIASYSVQSQRYVSKDDFDYIIPPEIEKIPEAKAEYIAAMEEDKRHYASLHKILSDKHYEDLIRQGKSPEVAKKDAQKKANEDARFVLPGSCDTKIVMTMNTRSLYNFFALRCCERAQWEIRDLAREMLRLVKDVSPLLFKNAGPSCVRGACTEGAFSCGKAKEMREMFKN